MSVRNVFRDISGRPRTRPMEWRHAKTGQPCVTWPRIAVDYSTEKQEAQLSLGWADRTAFTKARVQHLAAEKKQFPRVTAVPYAMLTLLYGTLR